MKSWNASDLRISFLLHVTVKQSPCEWVRARAEKLATLCAKYARSQHAAPGRFSNSWAPLRCQPSGKKTDPIADRSR